MKNLSTLISLVATASLALLAIAAAFGFPCPYGSVVGSVSGLAWATGVLGIFLTDYSPRNLYAGDATAPAIAARRAPAPVARRATRAVAAEDRPFVLPVPTRSPAPVRLYQDPATFSLS